MPGRDSCAAWPEAPDSPGLRDIQYALALEYGFPGWIELQRARRAARARSPREQAFQALLRGCRDGDAAGVESILASHPDIVNERGTLIGHTGFRTALHFGVAHAKRSFERCSHAARTRTSATKGTTRFPCISPPRTATSRSSSCSSSTARRPWLAKSTTIRWTSSAGRRASPNVASVDVVDYLLAHGARHTLHSAVAVAMSRRSALAPSSSPKPSSGRWTSQPPAARPAPRRDQAAARCATRAPRSRRRSERPRCRRAFTPLDEAALAAEHEMAQMLIDAGAKLTLAVRRRARYAATSRATPARAAGALKPGASWGTLIVRAAAHAPGEIIETSDSTRRDRERARIARDLDRRDAVVHGAARRRVPRKSRGRGGSAPHGADTRHPR